MIHIGDCLEVMRGLAENSVDAIVTDPPYGLTKARPGGRSEATRGAVMGGFMGLAWDHDVPRTEVWVECLRVLKPGGHLLAFAGTRTQHRMAVRIEDAGFEIRDMIAWVYGSGFPKSHNGPWGGTALKPALEPITVARKPLAATVAATWQEHGTGGLNIEMCRITNAAEPRSSDRAGEESATRRYQSAGSTSFAATPGPRGGDPSGRWPANVVHDGSQEVLSAFPFATGAMSPAMGTEPGSILDGGGSAARFFYCAKASKTDREDGLDTFGAVAVNDGRTVDADGPHLRGTNPRRNSHPTVKPTELMRWLCRLVTPRGGTVLDPFMGSGSTGKAAVLEGFQFIGIELDPAYAAIAEARIRVAQPGLPLGDVA